MKIKSRILLVLSLMLSQVACTSVSEIMKESLQDTSWVLQDIDGQALSTSYVMSVEFSGDNISGFGGCNRYRGGYTLFPDNLMETGFIMRSKKACFAEDRSKNEDLFVARLETARSYTIDGDSLIIKGESGSLGLTRDKSK